MEEQVVGPDPFPVDRMDTEERLADLGRILAAGIRRMRGAEPESDASAADSPRYVEVVSSSSRGRRTKIRIGGGE
jgi:hypothetical protein